MYIACKRVSYVKPMCSSTGNGHGEMFVGVNGSASLAARHEIGPVDDITAFEVPSTALPVRGSQYLFVLSLSLLVPLLYLLDVCQIFTLLTMANDGFLEHLTLDANLIQTSCCGCIAGIGILRHHCCRCSHGIGGLLSIALLEVVVFLFDFIVKRVHVHFVTHTSVDARRSGVVSIVEEAVLTQGLLSWKRPIGGSSRSDGVAELHRLVRSSSRSIVSSAGHPLARRGSKGEGRNTNARLSWHVAAFADGDFCAVEDGAVTVGASLVLCHAARASIAGRDNMVAHGGTAAVAAQCLRQAVACALQWWLASRLIEAICKARGRTERAAVGQRIGRIEGDVGLEEEDGLHASISEEAAAALAVQKVDSMLGLSTLARP